MGHKSGLAHTIPAGIVPQTDRQLARELERNQVSEIQELARLYTKDALSTLHEIMRNSDYKPGPRVSAAKALIEFGHGRAAQQIHRTGEGGRNLTINIVRFSGHGDEQEIAIDVGSKTDAEIEEIVEEHL